MWFSCIWFFLYVNFTQVSNQKRLKPFSQKNFPLKNNFFLSSGTLLTELAVLGDVMLFMTFRQLPIWDHPALVHRTSNSRLDPVSLTRRSSSTRYSAFQSSVNDKALYELITTPKNMSEERVVERLYCWEQTLLDTKFLNYRDVRAEFGLRSSKQFSSAPHFQRVYVMPFHISQCPRNTGNISLSPHEPYLRGFINVPITP